MSQISVHNNVIRTIAAATQKLMRSFTSDAFNSLPFFLRFLCNV